MILRQQRTLGETGTQQTRDLLDQGFGSQESIVLLGELLDELLVLVEPIGRKSSSASFLIQIHPDHRNALLQILNGHVLQVNLLGLIDVGGVGQNAERHSGSGNVGQLDGTRETLVSLGVVVLQTDLQLDGFDEVSLLASVGTIVVLGLGSLQRRLVQDGLDAGSHA